MSVAFVFPGQGSQAVGMGKGLAETFASARAVFDEVDSALGDKLSTVMWEGPLEKVTLTENAQPALVAVSLAAMRVLADEAGVDLKRDAQFVAGHSVGEYSALAATGALSLADAVRLVRTRGRAMQQAVPVGVGAMAALLGVDFEQAAAIASEAAQGEIVQAANDNGGGQVVVSGHKAAVERAVEIAKAKGVRRAMMLPVSGPFHSALMQPADIGPGGDRARPRCPGDRQRALARVDRLHGAAGRYHVLRSRVRQSAERARQAHRRGGERRPGRHAG
jgi:[acyl-carrier-protein] S-malonyltransferase